MYVKQNMYYWLLIRTITNFTTTRRTIHWIFFFLSAASGTALQNGPDHIHIRRNGRRRLLPGWVQRGPRSRAFQLPDGGGRRVRPRGRRRAAAAEQRPAAVAAAATPPAVAAATAVAATARHEGTRARGPGSTAPATRHRPAAQTQQRYACRGKTLRPLQTRFAPRHTPPLRFTLLPSRPQPPWRNTRVIFNVVFRRRHFFLVKIRLSLFRPNNGLCGRFLFSFTNNYVYLFFIAYFSRGFTFNISKTTSWMLISSNNVYGGFFFYDKQSCMTM